jgi:hypothetical protein
VKINFPIPIPQGVRPDLEALARETGSLSAAGDLTVFEAPGGQVSTAVVEGIVDLVEATTQDVTSRQVDDPSDEVDATEFITAVRPVRSEPPTGFDDRTFFDVNGGTTVTFEVHFQNDFLPEEPFVQIFRAQIEVHDLLSGTTLDIRNVYVVVPAVGGTLI